MNANTFRAPWGKTLCWMSAFSSVVLTAAVLPAFWVRGPEWVPWALSLPVLLVPGALLFIVRDYTLEPRELLIRRLLWTTHVPLTGLKSASYQPNMMRGSLRLFANGGMFSFTGWYRNRSLGNYRAFVTELKNTVVLRFEKKAVIISPDHPEQFVAEISRCAAQNS